MKNSKKKNQIQVSWAETRKFSITGWTDDQPMIIGYTRHLYNFQCRWNQVTKTLQHRFNRWSKYMHPCFHRTIVQRACFSGTKTFFNTGLNDAPSKHASVYCQKPVHYVRLSTATIEAQCDQFNRCPHRFNRCSRLLCSWLPMAMWASPLYIRWPLARFMMHLTY